MLQAYYIEHLDWKASCNRLYISSPKLKTIEGRGIHFV